MCKFHLFLSTIAEFLMPNAADMFLKMFLNFVQYSNFHRFLDIEHTFLKHMYM